MGKVRIFESGTLSMIEVMLIEVGISGGSVERILWWGVDQLLVTCRGAGGLCVWRVSLGTKQVTNVPSPGPFQDVSLFNDRPLFHPLMTGYREASCSEDLIVYYDTQGVLPFIGKIGHAKIPISGYIVRVICHSHSLFSVHTRHTRSIHLFTLNQATQTFSDSICLTDKISKNQWCSSGLANMTGHYYALNSVGQVHLWDTSAGTLRLVKTIEGAPIAGSRIPVTAYHPVHSMLVIGGSRCLMGVLPDCIPQSWEGLMSGVEEMQESAVYEEREDEFDIVGNDCVQVGPLVTHAIAVPPSDLTMAQKLRIT